MPQSLDPATRALAAAAIARFARAFPGREGVRVAVAPGRVNLIGEHTDYNDGFVLPLAIDRYVAVAVAPRADDDIVVQSMEFDGTQRLTIGELAPPGGAAWYDFVAGVAWAMRAAGYPVRGAELVLHGNVPVGSGLSSSAAVEVAVARALCEASGIEWDPLRMAQIAQRAENAYVGVQCGLMDQVAASASQWGAALLFDCRTFEWETVALPATVAVVVMDTGVRRSLATSEYNDRRGACDRAVAALRTIRPDVRALRDVDAALLAEARPRMDATAYLRASHVVSENARPRQMADALRRGDLTTAGFLMNESHRTLRDLYEVSSRELDLMCDIARAEPGCWGARMTGAGFGGCAIALVDRAQADVFAARVQERYETHVYRQASVFVSHPAAGARVIAPHELGDDAAA